jgi:hypothetical protein
MKALIFGLFLILVSCGEHTAYVYYPVNGVDGKDGKDYDESRIALLEEKVNLLVAQVAANESSITELSDYLNSLTIDLRLQEINEILLGLNTNMTSISTNFTAITNSLIAQIAALEGKLFEIVKPCSNSKEVLVKTTNGYLAYFQVGANKNITFQVNDTIPSHIICNVFAGNSGICKEFAFTPGSIATRDITISVFELKHAYLALLGEGVNYQTTDGVNCKFKIVENEIVVQ